MKNSLKTLSFAVLALIGFSCNNAGNRTTVSVDGTDTVAVEKSGTTAESNTRSVDIANSVIEWEGSKPLGKHHGTIKISDGTVEVDNGALTGGTFTIDMNSIVNTDLSGDDNAKLVGHLKSADFFDVEKYPTATFTITGFEPLTGTADANYNVIGDLKMKDITKSVKFPALIDVTDAGVNAVTPQFTIDRTEWNVQYGSTKFFKNLADNFIHDNMGIKIVLKTK